MSARPVVTLYISSEGAGTEGVVERLSGSDESFPAKRETETPYELEVMPMGWPVPPRSSVAVRVGDTWHVTCRRRGQGYVFLKDGAAVGLVNEDGTEGPDAVVLHLRKGAVAIAVFAAAVAALLAAGPRCRR